MCNFHGRSCWADERLLGLQLMWFLLMQFVQAKAQFYLRNHMADESKNEYAAQLQNFNAEQWKHFNNAIPHIFRVKQTCYTVASHEEVHCPVEVLPLDVFTQQLVLCTVRLVTRVYSVFRLCCRICRTWTNAGR